MDDIKPFAECEHLVDRLDPGSTVPHGECLMSVDGDSCGAFVYQVSNDRMEDKIADLL